MALLAIDQGNTRIKVGLFANGRLVEVWSSPTEKSATAAELAAVIFSTRDVPATTPLALCTVVPELLPAWHDVAAMRGHALTVITGATPTPLTNGYATPETLGPDRLMAAVAAEAMVGAPVIPISLGTATVVDAVAADRSYCGGLIGPGIGVTIDALLSATSALRAVDWHEPLAPIGRTSAESLNNGIFYHAVGGVQGMIAAVRRGLGVDAPLALTGGWAEHIAPFLDHVAVSDAYLILHGIALTLHESAASEVSRTIRQESPGW